MYTNKIARVQTQCVYTVVGGYVFMALTVNKEGGFKDFSNNIPNRSFWCSLPSLVVAGCMVTKETIMGLINKEKGDVDEPLGAD